MPFGKLKASCHMPFIQHRCLATVLLYKDMMDGVLQRGLSCETQPSLQRNSDPDSLGLHVQLMTSCPHTFFSKKAFELYFSLFVYCLCGLAEHQESECA